MALELRFECRRVSGIEEEPDVVDEDRHSLERFFSDFASACAILFLTLQVPDNRSLAFTAFP